LAASYERNAGVKRRGKGERQRAERFGTDSQTIYDERSGVRRGVLRRRDRRIERHVPRHRKIPVVDS